MPNLQPEAGKNHIRNICVLIPNTKAVGILRKDLICTLGTEQAKKLLISYGFTSGYHYAASATHDFSLDETTKSYPLHILFHTFVGAHVNPLELHCNEDKNNWFCEGAWHDSYEAVSHVKHFGSATEPVCWSLVGYASGILSALLGERVIIKEISCTAKGDPHCRFIGKTLARWGKEILPDLRYYQETGLSETLEQTYDKIREQNEILKQSAVIHEQINKMVFNGDDLSVIADTVGQIINGTIFVEDQFFRPIAYSSPTMSTEKDLPAQVSCSASDIFSNYRYRHLAIKLNQDKKSVLLPPESTSKPFARLIYPIVTAQDILGYISIFKISGEFTGLDRMTLKRAAAVFALKMMQTRAVAETENRLKGAFVEDLIAGNFNTETSIIERASSLGYNLSQPHQVLTIKIDNFSRLNEQLGQDLRQLLHFEGQLCETVSQALNVYNRHGMVTLKSNNIIVLTVLEEDATYPETVDLAQKIQERVSRQFPQKITVSVGIGRICHTPKDFPLSYQEARQALKVIKGLGQNNTVISFDRLGTIGLLFHAANQQDLLAFMQEQLGDLIEYDTKHQTQLVPTLHLYFSYDQNIKKAARAAAVTPSGFKYRIRKISEVGGFNLKEPDKRFDLQMALKIWYIIKAGDPKA